MADDPVVMVKVRTSTRAKLNRLREATKLDSADSVILWLMGDISVPAKPAVEMSVEKK